MSSTTPVPATLEELTAYFEEDPNVLEFAKGDTDFLNTLRSAVEEARQHAREKAAEGGFSDITHTENGQTQWYVDLVQEGGGILGIALVGYVYVLEKAGIRFLNLAGTSAGAINTVLLAAADTPDQPKAGKILGHIANLDLKGFQDGNFAIQLFLKALAYFSKLSAFITRYLPQAVFLVVLLLLFGLALFLQPLAVLAILITLLILVLPFMFFLNKDLGLHPGFEFEKWMNQVLLDFGVSSTRDLTEKMNTLPPPVAEQLTATATSVASSPHRLAVVASDLTTQTKVVFPQEAAHYFSGTGEVDQVNPAVYVRASMSVPIFFYPKTIEGIARDAANLERWNQKLLGPFEPPEKVQIVDGGIISNFPIDIFHLKAGIPRRPTFGVRLGITRGKFNNPEEMDPLGLLNTSFSTARMARDAEFIRGNPDFVQLVQEVDVGDHHWLNFNIDDASKRDLFVRGAAAATQFLGSFHWPNYRDKRKKAQLVQAQRILDLDVGEAIDRAEAEQISLSDEYKCGNADKHALEARLNNFKLVGLSFRVLWICDDEGSNNYEEELIRAINGKIDHATSSSIAQKLLASRPYDLIISDIARNGNSSEGLTFFQQLRERADSLTHPLPPLIFYISNLDRSRGVPPYSFGITNVPAELLHLVIDVAERMPR